MTDFKPVEFMFLRVIWDAHHIHFPLRIVGANIKELHVVPETAHPFGRKGLALAGAWKQLATPEVEGVLILDGDVVIDPHDYMMMLVAIHQDPAAVHIAPVKLWPSSKNDLGGWAWGHCRDGKYGQELELHPDFFAFNFTYIPRVVMEMAVADGLRNWAFPEVDRSMSRSARKARVRMTVVEGASPKHMHY